MGRLIIHSILSAGLMWDEDHILNVHVDTLSIRWNPETIGG